MRLESRNCSACYLCLMFSLRSRSRPRHNASDDAMKAIYNLLVAFLFYFYNNFVTNVPLYSLRHLYLRAVFGIKVGAGSSVHMGCFITGREIKIGDHSV